jgi:hypothetical protein
MAKVQNPLIGRSSQSMGGATFQTWKGINVLRTKPLTVANPKTDGQRTQRNRFAAMVAFSRLVASSLKAGFVEQAQQQTEYNAFMSANLMTATQVNTPDDVEVTYPQVEMAKGTLSGVTITTPLADNGGGAASVTVDSAMVVPADQMSDNTWVLFFNEDTQTATVTQNASGRGSFSTTPISVGAGTVHALAFTYRAGYASDSLYLGSVVVTN